MQDKAFYLGNVGLDNECSHVGDCEDIKPRIGLRPSFHALWHLHPLGVVDNLTDFDADAWRVAEKAAIKKTGKIGCYRYTCRP